MGSQLAPVLANIFMGFYKSKWLNEYNLNELKCYLRYVDEKLFWKATRFSKLFKIFK